MSALEVFGSFRLRSSTLPKQREIQNLTIKTCAIAACRILRFAGGFDRSGKLRLKHRFYKRTENGTLAAIPMDRRWRHLGSDEGPGLERFSWIEQPRGAEALISCEA